MYVRLVVGVGDVNEVITALLQHSQSRLLMALQTGQVQGCVLQAVLRGQLQVQRICCEQVCGVGGREGGGEESGGGRRVGEGGEWGREEIGGGWRVGEGGEWGRVENKGDSTS